MIGKRHLHFRAFTAAFVLSSIVACSADSFKASEEKIPADVKKATQKQITARFGKESLKGIPLLDASVDWNSIKNWPTEFAFKGENYTLSLLHWVGGEKYEKLASKSDIKDDWKIVATYEPKSGDPLSGLLITATFTEEGPLQDKGLMFQGKQVFFHQFYPKGELSVFMREDAESAAILLDCFDPQGKLVGNQKNFDYRWNGKKVDEKTFNQNKADLLKAPPK